MTPPKRVHSRFATALQSFRRFELFALLVLFWELGVRLGDVPGYLLPTPSAVVVALFKYAPVLGRHALVTLWETILGFLAAAVIGALVAIMVSYSEYLSRTFYPMVVALQAIPKVALAPILIAWFGIGLTSKVVMCFLVAFFPVVVNSMAGLMDVSSTLTEMTRSMKATKWQVFVLIRLPNALPRFTDGLKIAAPLSLIGAIVGEFIGASAGLGNLILVSQSNLTTALTFSTLVVLTILSLPLYYLLEWLDRRFIWWRGV